MTKPREFWVYESDLYEDDLDASNSYVDSTNWTGNWKSFHVIEKSAADKLAEALENLVSCKMDGSDHNRLCLLLHEGKLRLKEYLGEPFENDK